MLSVLCSPGSWKTGISCSLLYLREGNTKADGTTGGGEKGGQEGSKCGLCTGYKVWNEDDVMILKDNYMRHVRPLKWLYLSLCDCLQKMYELSFSSHKKIRYFTAVQNCTIFMA